MAPLEGVALPEPIQIEPIHTCNLRCVMCHVSYEKLTHRRLALLLEGLRGLAGAPGEPTRSEVDETS